MARQAAFIRTFLDRDIPQLGITVPAETLRRFWTMIAHYHGQVWNAAEFARSLGFGARIVAGHVTMAPARTFTGLRQPASPHGHTVPHRQGQ